MEQDQVKECWHQNVTQCHDTYITEFLPRLADWTRHDVTSHEMIYDDANTYLPTVKNRNVRRASGNPARSILRRRHLTTL
jgi:hypothetical protein